MDESWRVYFARGKDISLLKQSLASLNIMFGTMTY